MKITHHINAALRLQNVPTYWKIAKVITILKLGKPSAEPSSYRPISLLPVISKVFERLLIKRLNRIVEDRCLLPLHQFRFRSKHSTLDQVHRIINTVEDAIKDKKVCSALFLDVAQAFNKVWHAGLVHKLKKNFSKSYSSLLLSYLKDRKFQVRHEDAYFNYREILAGVPQGSVLGPLLYLLYTADTPQVKGVKVVNFADDSALLAPSVNTIEVTAKLQLSSNMVVDGTRRWHIKLNEAKSQLINFTLKKEVPIPIMISNRVPYSSSAKYRGMTLDAKIRWKEHIKAKRKQLNAVKSKMDWPIGRHSKLSIHNKLLVYKQILKPIWTYGLQLWGSSTESNTNIIQVFQNKVLRSIVNAPWYCWDVHIHRDLQMKTVEEEPTIIAKKHAI